jgi:hypothetical protein
MMKDKKAYYDRVAAVLPQVMHDAASPETAMDIETIRWRLSKRELPVTRREFQLQVKPAALDAGIPLAPCGRGMFIVTNRRGLKAVTDWYCARIDSEYVSLNRIESVYLNKP